MMVSTAIEHTATAGDDDAILVRRYLAGDQTAFESLYLRYFDRVHAIARGVLVDTDEALDATQEIFTLVLRHLGRFDGRSKFSTWLFRIAINRSIQQSRSSKRRKREVPLEEAPFEPSETMEFASDPRISASLAQVAPSDRAILVLFYWEEMSLQEIADSLGVSVNAAKTRLFRARERFKTVYSEGRA